MIDMLTLSNYYTSDNKYLTNSKISDYLASPHYFYRKHVLGEIESKPTKAMIFGSAVDFLLAQDDDKPVFQIVSRKNLKNPPNGYVEVNESEYKEIFEVADAVANTKVFKDIDKNFQKNVILSIDKPIGKYFVGLAGRPDYLKITDKEIIIGDLKTARTTDPRKYFYHCKEYGYFRQQAFYQMLADNLYPERKMKSYHLVVDKIKDIYNVQLFELDEEEIFNAKVELLKIIKEISQRTDYSKPKLSWKDAIKLRDPRTEYFDEDGD